MRFTPKTEKEIQEMNLISPGIYDFEVISASDKMSKTGNEMIELKIKIWDINNQERIIFDYLLEAMSFKLRHFAEATGLLQKYESGMLLAKDCLGKSGKVEIIIQKDKNGQYGDKNAVKDYISSNEISHAEPIKKDDSFLNDEIPF